MSPRSATTFPAPNPGGGRPPARQRLQRRGRWSSPLLVAFVLTSCACTDGPRTGPLVSDAVEQAAKRPVLLWLGETPVGAGLVLAPFCPESERERFTWRRLAHEIGIDEADSAAGTGQLAVLWAVNSPERGGGRDLVLPDGRPIIRAVAEEDRSGRPAEYEDLPLGQRPSVRTDPLLQALVLSGAGARTIPVGKAARGLVWIPGIRLESADTISVLLEDEEIRLRPGTVPRESWWRFEERLDLEALVEEFEPRPAREGRSTGTGPEPGSAAGGAAKGPAGRASSAERR